jgi:hypothetical protein
MSARISDKALALGATIIVVATIIAGLIAIGSPQTQRRHMLDERRIEDLSAIVRAMPGYWDKNHALPPDLAALAKQPGLHLHLSDPETGAGYEYATTAEKSFRLCAAFAAESADQSQGLHDQVPAWLHGAGRYCFERKLSAEAGNGRTTVE